MDERMALEDAASERVMRERADELCGDEATEATDDTRDDDEEDVD